MDHIINGAVDLDQNVQTVGTSKDSGLEIDDQGTDFKSAVTNGHLDETNNSISQRFQKMVDTNRRLLKTIFFGLIHLAVGVYFGFATNQYIESEKSNYVDMDENRRCWGSCGIQFCDGYGMFLLLICFVYFGLCYFYVFKPYLGKRIYKKYIVPFTHRLKGFTSSKLVQIFFVVLLLIAFAVFLYFETYDAPEKLTSLTGPAVFISLGYIFSKDRTAIKWRPIIFGIVAQFLLGVICIRWKVGRSIFQCIGDKVATFLAYTNEGSRFVFGEELIQKQVFAFAILPVIFFFSLVISVLYYLQVMQWVILKLGWLLQSLLSTTVCESVIAAANIFLGMSESPLLIRPYLKLLTKSELHAIMASGFATVSGTVLAAYMSFGADPALLITSSVMAAPAALAMAKLYYPEIEESKTKSNNIEFEKSADTSLLDAASKGAGNAIEIVLGIIANLVAFVSFIAFINGIVDWLGYLIGEKGITFEWIFAKLFIPLSWSLGVEWDDCDIVAKVIASKTIINEFVAYERLGYYKNQTMISPRSAGIATFAICGFANPSSLGILIGSLSAMAPQMRSTITNVAFRAFIVGCIVCFTSASFAGLLMPEEMINSVKAMQLPVHIQNSTNRFY